MNIVLALLAKSQTFLQKKCDKMQCCVKELREYFFLQCFPNYNVLFSVL